MNLNDQFNGKNILITGGIGFIGSNLAIALVGYGANVTVVDSLIPEYGGNKFNIRPVENRLITNIADVRDRYSMNHLVQDKDYLFNLAGQTSHSDSMVDPHTDLDVNCRAQLSMLESCRTYNPEIKIVFASTRQIYGKPDYLPVDEKHPLRPVDVNGINKMSGERYHILYNNVYGIKACSLRLTNTYGPRMRVKDARQTFLGIWIRLLIEGRPIKVFGDGTQLRDFNYVTDVTNALLLAAVNETTYGNIYNLGSEEVINLKDLAQLLVSVNKSGQYEIVPFPEDRKAIDIGDYYSDHSAFTAVTGWKPSESLKDGLKKTLMYYKENKSWYWDR